MEYHSLHLNIYDCRGNLGRCLVSISHKGIYFLIQLFRRLGFLDNGPLHSGPCSDRSNPSSPVKQSRVVNDLKLPREKTHGLEGVLAADRSPLNRSNNGAFCIRCRSEEGAFNGRRVMVGVLSYMIDIG